MPERQHDYSRWALDSATTQGNLAVMFIECNTQWDDGMAIVYAKKAASAAIFFLGQREEELVFKCHKCGADTDIAPDPPEVAVCKNCCADHNYVYISGERRHACEHCGKERPEDW